MTGPIPSTDKIRHDYAVLARTTRGAVERAKDFDRWLAKVKDESWAEGYDAGIDAIAAMWHGTSPTPNPYRE